MKKLIFLFACILCLVPGRAQTVQVAESHVPETASFAQPFEAALIVTHTPGTTVTLSSQPATQDFEITDKQQEQTSPGTTAFRFTVMPFALQLSTFTVTLDVQSATTAPSSHTLEFPITVKPVRLFRDPNFREIRNPKVPVSWLKWLLVALILGIILYLLFWGRKKTEDQGPAWQRFGKEVDNRPCHVIALSKIDALVNSGLWEKQQYKIFYISLFDILREYLWRRFSMDASADTSTELLRHAKKINGLNPVLPELKEFLTAGDLVKFAKVVPSEAQRNRDITYLQTLIRKTTPQPPTTQEEKK